ncbi:MAG TPA: Rv2175c family DNA-binding protein [Actinomycetes bacterium]|nr:Rv2175c family DNA-binding protein [Actinomycetes bacterium]
MTGTASLDTTLTSDVDALVQDWLTVPEVADELGIDIVHARQALKDRQIVAVRRGDRRVISVPAAFIHEGVIVKKLPGLLTLLADAGYDENQAIRWLFTDDDTLPGPPIRALVENRGTEVRRRAQALAF